MVPVLVWREEVEDWRMEREGEQERERLEAVRLWCEVWLERVLERRGGER